MHRCISPEIPTEGLIRTDSGRARTNINDQKVSK